jgi:phage gpG-like protein
MARSVEEKLREIQKNLAQTFRELPAIMGEEMVNYSLDAFDKEAWDNQKWPKRKDPTKWGKRDDTSRRLLVKTLKLKRSIRIGQMIEDRIIMNVGGADVPYARVHNEGWTGTVAQTVDAHLRRGKGGKVTRVKEFSRTIKQDMPKRQFVGTTPELKDRIKKIVMQEIFKNLK